MLTLNGHHPIPYTLHVHLSAQLAKKSVRLPHCSTNISSFVLLTQEQIRSLLTLAATRQLTPFVTLLANHSVPTESRYPSPWLTVRSWDPTFLENYCFLFTKKYEPVHSSRNGEPRPGRHERKANELRFRHAQTSEHA